MTEPAETSHPPKVIAAITCDFERSAVGTRSRLREIIGKKSVLSHVLERLLTVGGGSGLSDLVLQVPSPQLALAQSFANDPRIHIMELIPRAADIDARIRTGRAWNLCAWRGGAGQFTAFDEEYHPASVAHACRTHSADHVLTVHSHSAFLDVEMTSALLHHHLHKNREMRVTYTPSAPGLCGMFLRADIAIEMGEKSVMPWQLLAYDPAHPNFDTLIREACMQVDPAVSKIPNRFCVDTDRSFQFAKHFLENPDKETRGPGDKETEEKFLPPSRRPFVPLSPCPPVPVSSADLALAAARTIAPGVRDFSHVAANPREVEIELTGRRLVNPPGSVPALIREARRELDATHWERWFAKSIFPDDLLLTFAGDGDAGLYHDLPRVLRAARTAKPLSICVQTDLAAEDIGSLLAAIDEKLLDVLTIPLFGHTTATYDKLARVPCHATVMRNMQKLAAATTANGGLPLVIPRLLKVRDTIPELEPFFDAWLQQSGWAVIEAPTDRAGAIPFEAVVDMAPPKRRPCRRLWDRLLIRANGNAVACDQDIHDILALGNIESHSLEQLWNSPQLTALRQQHADGNWKQITPCSTCREWHRP